MASGDIVYQQTLPARDYSIAMSGNTYSKRETLGVKDAYGVEVLEQLSPQNQPSAFNRRFDSTKSYQVVITEV